MSQGPGHTRNTLFVSPYCYRPEEGTDLMSVHERFRGESTMRKVEKQKIYSK